MDLSGTYNARGTNPGGEGGYEAKLILARTGDVYRVEWYFDGQLGAQGVGLAGEGSLSVGYRMGDGYGVVVYEVGDDGTLRGQWAIPGTLAAGTEVATRE
jgi:hypothetical protein